MRLLRPEQLVGLELFLILALGSATPLLPWAGRGGSEEGEGTQCFCWLGCP